MAEASAQRERWLVAAWPGMGNVGVGAAAFLMNKLGARMVHELPGRDVFDVEHIEVTEGLARAGRMPRSMFFEWNHPEGKADLLIFIGEAQPQSHGYAFCHRLLDYAVSRDITHVITFAAMATQLHPSDAPRVFGVATSGQGIRRLQSLDVNLLKEGQITGLNGVLLAVAAERTLPAMCLLGELPFFAGAVPNPRAAQAVLEVFSTMVGIELDFSDLKEQAEAVEQALLKLLDKLQQSAREQGETGEEFTVQQNDEGESESIEEEPGDIGLEAKPAKPEAALDLKARRKIESLFAEAAKDHSKAVKLKQELDRLGVFKQYEDRFLDLFKKGH